MCSYSGDIVTIDLQNDTATVTKGNLQHIHVNGVWCGSEATTDNTRYIVVNGYGTADSLVIDLNGGAFSGDDSDDPYDDAPEQPRRGCRRHRVRPVRRRERDRARRAESQRHHDRRRRRGVCELAHERHAGPFGCPSGFINLNDDTDADVWDEAGSRVQSCIRSVAVTIDGQGGNDNISGQGDDGTGEPWGDKYCGHDNPPLPLTLNGGAGDDEIHGGVSDDFLIGGPGNDVIDGGGDSADEALGAECKIALSALTGTLDDLLSLQKYKGDTVVYAGSPAAVTVDLDPGEVDIGAATGDGTDVIQNVENIWGSPFNDTLSGDDTGNNILGFNGDDTIAGDAGNDCLWGNEGNDTFDENEGTSVAQGGVGTNNGSDFITGNNGLDDHVTYSARTTSIVVYLEPIPSVSVWLDEDDGCRVKGDQDVDRAAGGGGFNEPLAQDGADVNGDGDSSDLVDERDCIFLDVENATGGSGNDRLDAAFVANRADNEFTGSGGNDVMVGGAGNDTFHEGPSASGADDMDGGTGGDTCDYGARSNAVSVSMDGVDNDGEAGEGDNCGGVAAQSIYWNYQDQTQPQSSPANVENVNGGSGNDQLVGSDAGNVINGNAGNDALTGGGSTDTLNGGDGDDWLSGGGGNDALNGGAGTNTADYSGAGSGGVGVNVNLTTGAASGDGNDTLSGIQNANGSSFADALRGDENANTLNGRGGQDAIQGSGGDDVINGGAGNDEVGGGAGNDRMSGQNGSDTMRGGAGNDNLGGGNGPDTLYGGGGNDTLAGGAGKDWHGGGPGNDSCNPGAPGLGNGDVAVSC